MMTSDKFAMAIQILAIVASFIAVLASFVVAAGAMKALRAKHRAQWHIRRIALTDHALVSLLQTQARQKLTSDDIEKLLHQIEELTASLPESDRKYVRQGLHQDSRDGARRYVREVLSVAS